MIFILCVFKTTVHSYNISSYIKEQLKLHRSLLGVKGGGHKAFSPITLSCNGKNQYFRPNLTNTLTMYIQHITNILFIFFPKLWGWGQKKSREVFNK